MPSAVFDPRDTGARQTPSTQEATFLWENRKLVDY